MLSAVIAQHANVVSVIPLQPIFSIFPSISANSRTDDVSSLLALVAKLILIFPSKIEENAKNP